MTWDYDALYRSMLEAERAMGIAQQRITEQKAKIDELEAENQRLRLRLVKAMAVIEHYESPDQG